MHIRCYFFQTRHAIVLVNKEDNNIKNTFTSHVYVDTDFDEVWEKMCKESFIFH